MERLLRISFGVVAVLAAVGGVSLSTAYAQSPVTWILRLAIAAGKESPSPLGERTQLQSRLADGYVFNSIPRIVGQRFVIVTNALLFVDRLNILKNTSFSAPILFSSDPISAIPSEFSDEIRDKCPEGWATIEYIGADALQESFRINCGSDEQISVILSREPSTPGEYEGEKKSYNIGNLKSTLESFEIIAQGEIRATLTLITINSNGEAIAIAFKDPNAGGIADFWKFFPRSNAALTDNAHNAYTLVEATGLGYARDADDWNILLPSEEIVISLIFSSDGHRAGSSFNLTFGVWMVRFPRDRKGELQGVATIRIADVRPRR